MDFIKNRIKGLLKERDRTQEWLADQLELTPQGFGKALNKSDFKLSQIIKIAEALDKPVGYFFTEGNGNSQENNGSHYKAVQGNVTIHTGNKLTEQEKDAEILKLRERIDLLVEKIVDREKQLEDKQKLLDQVIEGKERQIARIIDEKEKQIELYKRMIEMLEKK